MLPLIVLALIVLLGMGVLVVDVTMLFTAKEQSRIAAEAAALAGAGWLRDNEGDMSGARREAIKYGEMNPVLDRMASLRPWDVDATSWCVTARVRNEEARNNPIPTGFASFFGVGSVDLGSQATACVQEGDTIRLVGSQ